MSSANIGDRADWASSMVAEYLRKGNWRSSENANSTFSLQALNQYISNSVVTEYWLKSVYSKRVSTMVKENRFHIHDLGYLSAYCCGWSIEDLLTVGFGGVENKVFCRPAKHLVSALNHVVNFLFTLQGELAGAQAVSNLDTFMAPFIRFDGLNEQDVYKCVQSFVYSLNVPTRVGFQAPFTNVSMDITCPAYLKDRTVIIGGQTHPSGLTYGEFQAEMDMFNRTFCKAMAEGDGKGSIFSFPIPTYNLAKDFDWESERYKPIWEMTARYGIPYFANFINSDLNPDDFRSMCCRLRIDTTKLQTRNGGMFGSVPLTGSMGVVTLNLPNLAIRSLNKLSNAGSAPSDLVEIEARKKAFLSAVDDAVSAASESLCDKRRVVESNMRLYPFAAHYLRSVKERTGKYWSNHFSTIGLNGMHEACRILLGSGIESNGAFALEALEHIKVILLKYQEEQGCLYNLEATPAESTCYKFASGDRELFPEVAAAGFIPEYYTNSTMLPVAATSDVFAALDHQQPLHCAYTGGTVFHTFIGERLQDWRQARDLVKIITTRYRVPYVSLTPTFSVCRKHGYLAGEQKECPKCSGMCLVYSRIVGYYRPVQDWNPGKKAEFKERRCYDKLGGTSVQCCAGRAPPDVRIGGFRELSAINWPGEGPHSVLFLSGCNLSCSWCHNAALARGDESEDPTLTVQKVVDNVALSPHRRLVVTGGEPTIWGGALIHLLEALKTRGIKVKLDTNGTNPDLLKYAFEKNLVDFVAMDIKGRPEKYGSIAGKEVKPGVIEESIKIIERSGLPHQFRITEVPGLVDVEDIAWATNAAGSSGLYRQAYERPMEETDQSCDDRIKRQRPQEEEEGEVEEPDRKRACISEKQ